MSFVTVDLGASSTRYTADMGKVMVVPNNIVAIQPGTCTDLIPDASDIESSLELTIERTDDKIETVQGDFFPATVLVGQMANRYSSSQQKPSGMSNKYTQKINYVDALLGAALARVQLGAEEDIDLYLAVPPVEVKLATEAFREKLVGNFLVSFPKYLDGSEVKLNIRSVNVQPESYMSTVSFLFNLNGTVKEENKEYFNGKLLSIDIGASTTDLVIVDNGKLLEKTGKTIKVGGNVAREYLKERVAEMYGFDIPDEDSEKVMAEGRIKIGASYEDATAIINQAKAELARSIIAQLQSYFSSVNIPLQTISYMMVSGGGSMQSQYINDSKEVVCTSAPMSAFVTEQLQSICNTVKVIPYGDDARLANVKGLFIRASLDKVIAAKRAQVQAAANKAKLQAATGSTNPVASQQTANTTQQTVSATPVATQQAVATQPTATTI